MKRQKKKTNIINIILLVSYLIMTAVSAVVGVRVTNLFVQFAATIMTILSLYNIIVLLVYSRQLHDMNADVGLPMTMTAMTGADILIKPQSRLITMPMTDIRMRFVLSDNAGLIPFEENIDFTKQEGGSTIGKMHIRLSRHGDFIIDKCHLRIRPVLSVWDYSFPIECKYKMRVLPQYKDIRSDATHINFGDTDGTSHKSMQNSTDLFDNRKYYPGDDPRKINWKILSHTGELQIRQSEHTATNYGNQNVIFVPWSRDIEEYEQVTTLFIGICNALLKDDTKLNIISPKQTAPINVTSANISRLDDIINDSYKEFDGHITQTEYQIVIGSPTQLCRLLSEVKLTDSIIMSVEDNSLIGRRVSAAVIETADMLALDLHRHRQADKALRLKKTVIDELKQLSGTNKLVLY